MDDESLVLSVGRGDHGAFAVLMERHGTLALRLALRLTGDRQEAEEAVQESFLKVWAAAARWDPRGGAKFSTWLYRVVVNASLDRKRRAPMLGMDAVAEPVDPQPGGLERCSAAQARDLVAQALASLPERQRAAVALCYFGEVNGQDAAEALEISVSALESLLVRGRRSLREFFARRGLTSLGDVL